VGSDGTKYVVVYDYLNTSFLFTLKNAIPN